MKARYVIALLAILLVTGSVFAQNPRDLKFSELTFNPAEPVRFTTENGMTVYFLEYHELPVITLTAYFRGGDVYDPADKAGLSELTAQLIRTGGAGTRTANQVDQDLDFIGASIGSSSDDDLLSVNMRVLKKDASTGFEILSDMLIRPTFAQDRLAMEASNKQDEIRRQNDDSWSISRRVFYQTVYQGHPYGDVPTLASVDNITRDDVVSQHKYFYRPDNCILAIAGDMTADEAKATIKKYFGSWKTGGDRIEEPSHATMQYKPGVYYAEKDINQANIRLGHLSIDDKNPDRYALEVTNFALGGGGFSSRLTGQVRTTAGLAYSVGSYEYIRPFGGCFFGYCLTRAETMSQAVSMMIAIIDTVQQKGITREEMDLAKESILNSYIFDYDTPGELVAAKALLELRGYPSDQLQKNLEGYKSVTLADCNRVAREYLKTSDLAIVVTGNKELFDKPLETFGAVTAVSMDTK